MKPIRVITGSVVVLAVVWQVSSAPASGRTLTEDEAWLLYGGASEECHTDVGRCYPYPNDCSEFDGQICDQFVVYELIHGTGETCEPSSNPQDTCVEFGDDEICMQYCHCTTQYNEDTGEPETCLLIVPQGGWTLDSVEGPEDANGDDCP